LKPVDIFQKNDVQQNVDVDMLKNNAFNPVFDKEGHHNQHINLNAVINYLRGNGYPSYLTTKNEKSNFRRQSKAFKMDNGTLIYKKSSAKVIIDKIEQKSIIEMVHDGSDYTIESSALSSHRGRDATQRILKSRFYWPNMSVDIKNYIKECDVCQKINPASLKFVPELKSVAVPKKVKPFSLI